MRPALEPPGQTLRPNTSWAGVVEGGRQVDCARGRRLFADGVSEALQGSLPLGWSFHFWVVHEARIPRRGTAIEPMEENDGDETRKDSTSAIAYSHEYEVLWKDIHRVDIELNVAGRIDVKKCSTRGALYSPCERKKIYVGNLKKLQDRLQRPLKLPPHSIEFQDDVAQLHSDVKQVLRCGLDHAHEVTFPRVALGKRNPIAKRRRSSA